MRAKLPIVALIGQTNAGKSSLLNRFARQNIAIVAREEGTTRDNVITKIDDKFLLIDTAGLKNPEDSFEAQIQDQIADAVASADLILLTLDSSKYPDDRDRQIAKSALKSKKPVFLLLNKADLGASLPSEEFLRLGIKPEQTFRLSATTGQGISELKNAIFEELYRGKDAFSKPIADLGAPRTIFQTTHESSSRRDGFSGGPAYEFEGDQVGQEKTSLPSPAESPAKSLPLEPTAVGQEKASKPSPAKSSAAPNLKIALIGRPNVGKSSLFNSLAKKQQALVSSRQGTTRDINRLEIKYNGQTIEILDTAGLRRPGKREVGIEKFSALRTLAAIEESDISALLVDATEPHSKLDQSLAGQIVEAGKGIIVILTKSDLKTAKEIDQILDDLERDFNFLPFAPVLITSSETGKNVTKLFELAEQISNNRKQQIKTSDLNKILNEAIISHPPAGLKNTKPKPKYIVQTDSNPPWFVVHGHDLGLLHWSWKRYLERKIREKYPFVGTPIKISYKESN